MIGVQIGGIGLKFLEIMTCLGSKTSSHFCRIFANNVSFSGKLGNFPEILFGHNGSDWCVDLWNRTEILIDCHIIRGNTSKSQQNHFCPNFAHSASFSGKRGNFPKILSGRNGSDWCAD